MSILKALPAAALLFLPSSAANVHSVSVVPSSGKTEVVIGVDAAVEVQDFALDAPARVVVDLKGATLDMSHRRYDRIARGGIINIRYSQFAQRSRRDQMDASTHICEAQRGEVRIALLAERPMNTHRGRRAEDGYDSRIAAPAELPPVRAVHRPADVNPLRSSAPAAVHTRRGLTGRSTGAMLSRRRTTWPLPPNEVRTRHIQQAVALFARPQSSRRLAP